jgi:hypothetical protein
MLRLELEGDVEDLATDVQETAGRIQGQREADEAGQTQ